MAAKETTASTKANSFTAVDIVAKIMRDQVVSYPFVGEIGEMVV